MSEKKKKGWLVRHAKSSAAVISLVIHAVLILVAVFFVAVTVIQKEDQTFEARPVNRPRQKLRKLQVPVNIKKHAPQPKLRKRIVVQANQRSTPEFQMPEVAGVKGGMGGAGLGTGIENIGFSMPEIDYFGAKAKGETICFVVHFGPDTLGKTPASRMTGYVIRKRLQELVGNLPGVALFNTFAYFQGGGGSMNPTLLAASPENKQKVNDWMAPANPLEGGYAHALEMFANNHKYNERVVEAAQQWPTRVDKLPWYSLKWLYPYEVPEELQNKYCPEKPNFQHWVRGVAWAALEQKADTIFVLTTNYIDFFGTLRKKWNEPGKFEMKGKPGRTAEVFEQIFTDVYGKDRKKWPTVNIVVLTKGKETDFAYATLNAFQPLIDLTRGNGSIITDIRKFMNDEEKDLLKTYSR